MPTILITRPQAASENLAMELHEQGYAGVIEPLLSIVPTPSPLPETPCQAVMITSANALEALAFNAADISGLIRLPCFCVGKRTAEKAAEFGFTRAQSADGDGIALAQLIATHLADTSKPILHICGADVDSKAQEELTKLGLTTEPWSVYTAQAAVQLSAHTIKLLKQQSIDAVLAFSPRTAETLNELMYDNSLLTCCAQLTVIALSQAVADVLRPLPWRKVLVASNPTEDAVIACLKEALPA